MLNFYPSFSPTLSSFFILCFILLLYSLTKYVLTTHCTPACASTAHSQVQMCLCCELRSYLFLFLLLLCISSILSIFMKTVSKCLSNRPPTLTCGSSRTTQAYCALLHASMKFWEVSFIFTTSFIIYASVPKISSTPYTVRVVRFSFVSCTA
jgi:hypothetical protein